MVSSGGLETIRIGVLSHRGDAATLEAWSPSANYLTVTVPGTGLR